MGVWLAVGLLAAGFAITIKGADWLVEGGSSLGRRLGASELTIGLTVVAFGTSAPELFVNLAAVLSGAGSLAFGNIIGSNIMNSALVLGLAGLAAPLPFGASLARKELPLSLAAGAAVWLLASPRGEGFLVLGRGAGLFLLAGFGVFLTDQFRAARRVEPEAEAEEAPARERSLVAAWSLAALGLGCLALGGRLATDGAVRLAEVFGVSQALIGLTVTAMGTSLPETTASLAAAFKGRTAMAVGNVIGSNLFNLLLILGLSALARPVVFPRRLLWDALFYLAVNGLVLGLILRRRRLVLRRRHAALLLLSYLGYLAVAVWRG